MVHGQGLEGRGRGVHQHDIVPASGARFGRNPRGQIGDGDVVNSHGYAVLFTPGFAEIMVEPLIEGGDEMAPLENTQAFGRRRGPARNAKKRPQRQGR